MGALKTDRPVSSEGCGTDRSLVSGLSAGRRQSANVAPRPGKGEDDPGDPLTPLSRVAQHAVCAELAGVGRFFFEGLRSGLVLFGKPKGKPAHFVGSNLTSRRAGRLTDVVFWLSLASNEMVRIRGFESPARKRRARSWHTSQQLDPAQLNGLRPAPKLQFPAIGLGGVLVSGLWLLNFLADDFHVEKNGVHQLSLRSRSECQRNRTAPPRGAELGALS